MLKIQKNSKEDSDLEEIRKGFEMFDTDGTGLVNPSEIKEAMESMNLPEKNPFIYEIISSLSSDDTQYKNGISIDDLVNYVYEKVNDNESNLGLKQLFDALKDPGTNTISMHTFMKLAKDYEEDDFSGDELRYLLEKTQLGGDELTFEEFCTIMKGGMSSASVRSEEPDIDRKNIESMDNNIITQEIREESINQTNDDNNKNDSIENNNNKEIEIEINKKENDNENNSPIKEIKIEEKIENNNDDINKEENNTNLILEKPENLVEIDNKEIPIINNENENKNELNNVEPITEIKVEEENVKKRKKNPK